MDEPTTHLDMRSIEALVGALRQYQGTLLFISHDAYFIRQIATSVLQVQDGAVTLFPGDYDYYLDKSARDAAVLAGQRTTANGSERERTTADSSESGKERKRREAAERQAKHRLGQELQNRLSEVERRIVALERRQNELVSALESQNEENSGAAASLELKQVADELSRLLPEWERLAEQSAGNAGNAGNGES